MKSLKQVMLDRLQAIGMLSDQAEAVFNEAVKDESLAAMWGRWSDEADGYPQGIVNSSWLALRDIAYKWICKNAPTAWYRPAFAPGADTAIDGEAFVKAYWERVGKQKQSPFAIPDELLVPLATLVEYPDVDEGGMRKTVEQRNG